MELPKACLLLVPVLDHPSLGFVCVLFSDEEELYGSVSCK